MAIINNYELLLTGSFEDKIIINEKKLVSKGNTDFLICQFDESGDAVWVEQFGSILRDKGVSVLSTTDGHIIVGGNFQDMVITSRDTLFSSGFSDIVILNYDKNHRLQWTRQLGNENNDQLHSLAINDVNVYTTGNFRGYLNINSEEFNSSGSDDILLASFPISVTNESGLSVYPSMEMDNTTIQIRPNPSSGIFRIFSNSKESLTIDIKIKSTLAKEVRNYKNKDLPAEINLSSLSGGIYFVYISFHDKKLVKKIVVKH